MKDKISPFKSLPGRRGRKPGNQNNSTVAGAEYTAEGTVRLKDGSPLRPPRGNPRRLLRGGDAYGLQSEKVLKQRGGEKVQWRWRNCHALDIPKAVSTGEGGVA